jgi:AcrR family transcriptional regulator
VTVVWDRPVPERKRNVPLDRAKIVAAAIAIADTEGLDAVTIRRVAGALGVLPMRLYTYLESKADLADLMIDEVYAGVTVPSARSGWRTTLVSIAAGLRTAAASHPWAVSLFGSTRPYGPSGLRLVDRVWAAVSGDAASATAFIGYVTGALQQELGAPDTDEVSGYLARTVAGGSFPALAKAFTGRQPGETFRAGLDVTLDGIAARLRGRSGTA